MKHEEWIKLKKIEVLDELGTILQLAIFGLGIVGCAFVAPIFYIPIIAGCILYANIVYHGVSAMIFDIQIDLWNDRFEYTMDRMIKVRR